jgi:hypothetical protein
MLSNQSYKIEKLFIVIIHPNYENIIFSYNITSGMIIMDDIMSEIELEISRVRRTSEMSCFNFRNLISSMINHTTCYIR